MTHLRTGAIFTVAVMLAAISGVPEAGNAGSRYGEREAGPVYRNILAKSAFSSRSVVAPVRRGPYGNDQVMTPAGNWYDCDVTCEYTLRKVYLDFWQAQGDGTVPTGIFRFEFVLD